MRKYLCLAALFLPWVISAQNVLGKVTNAENTALVGANVYWANTNTGVTTGERGEFELTQTTLSPASNR